MTNINTALGQKIFHVPQAQREPDIHHHNQTNNLGR